jgi:hypothetical protein
MKFVNEAIVFCISLLTWLSFLQIYMCIYSDKNTKIFKGVVGKLKGCNLSFYIYVFMYSDKYAIIKYVMKKWESYNIKLFIIINY